MGTARRIGDWLTIPMLVVAAVSGVISGGCGPSEPVREYAAVSGRVSYQGKPLNKGSVTFQSAFGAPVMAEIQQDGTYRMDAVVGSNTVMIVNREADPGPLAPGEERKRIAAAKAAMDAAKTVVPDKYSTPASPLKFDVPHSGSTSADFDIP
jgi:hypothetical protein